MPKKSLHCTIYIVRHGETEYNVKRLLQGQMDSPLTPVGISQAEEVGRKLKGVVFDRIFSSDLLRARRTAEIIGLEHRLAVEAKEALRERSFGRFEGQPYEAVDAEYLIHLAQWQALSAAERFKTPIHPEIEPDELVVSRFIALTREVALGYPGKTVLMVSHGGLMHALLIHLGFLHYDLGKHAVKNTAYIKLETDGIEFKITDTFGIDPK